MKVKSISKNQTVINLDRASVFVSYETPVAAFIEGQGYFRTETKWSQTTTRHINKWLGSVDATEKPQEFFDGLLTAKEITNNI